MREQARPVSVPLSPLNFAGALGRQIVQLHMWVVREGIRGADAAAIFDGLCQTATPGGAISTPLSPRNLAAVTSTSRFCCIAHLVI